MITRWKKDFFKTYPIHFGGHQTGRCECFQIHAYGRQLIAAVETDKALDVFRYKLKRFEGAWPTNNELARSNSAKGDFKNAIKYLKSAKKNVPEGGVVSGLVIETNLQKLKEGEDIN